MIVEVVYQDGAGFRDEPTLTATSDCMSFGEGPERTRGRPWDAGPSGRDRIDRAVGLAGAGSRASSEGWCPERCSYEPGTRKKLELGAGRRDVEATRY